MLILNLKDFQSYSRSIKPWTKISKATLWGWSKALPSSLKSNKPHYGRAYERFTKNGPIALLPNTSNTFTLVWTGPKKYIDEIAKLNNDSLLKILQENFGKRAGEFVDINLWKKTVRLG